MEFLHGGRYLVQDAGPEDASAYSQVHLACLDTAYEHIIGPGFGARNRAESADLRAEDRGYLRDPRARAAIAWENPQAGDTNDYGCCAIGADPDLWTRPVGIALLADGPQPWEAGIQAPPLPGPGAEPPRVLVNLYVLPDAQGRGLGTALLEAVLRPEDPAYLWLIHGNDAARRFYERHGFADLGEDFACDGHWAPARTGRMARGLRMHDNG